MKKLLALLLTLALILPAFSCTPAAAAMLLDPDDPDSYSGSDMVIGNPYTAQIIIYEGQTAPILEPDAEMSETMQLVLEALNMKTSDLRCAIVEGADCVKVSKNKLYVTGVKKGYAQIDFIFSDQEDAVLTCLVSVQKAPKYSKTYKFGGKKLKIPKSYSSDAIGNTLFMDGQKDYSFILVDDLSDMTDNNSDYLAIMSKNMEEATESIYGYEAIKTTVSEKKYSMTYTAQHPAFGYKFYVASEIITIGKKNYSLFAFACGKDIKNIKKAVKSFKKANKAKVLTIE